jgi:hypothetical protein
MPRRAATRNIRISSSASLKACARAGLPEQRLPRAARRNPPPDVVDSSRPLCAKSGHSATESRIGAIARSVRTGRRPRTSNLAARLTFRAFWSLANPKPSLRALRDLLQERYLDLSSDQPYSAPAGSPCGRAAAPAKFVGSGKTRIPPALRSENPPATT